MLKHLSKKFLIYILTQIDDESKFDGILMFTNNKLYIAPKQGFSESIFLVAIRNIFVKRHCNTNGIVSFIMSRLWLLSLYLSIWHRHIRCALMVNFNMNNMK